jgi:polar amino acid transport system substrate-binding protein
MRVRTHPRFLTSSLAAAALLLAAGCGGGAEEAAPGGGSAKAPISETPRPSLTKLVPASHAKNRTLRVGVAVGSPPDEFKDEHGELVGWEVDLVRASAEALGMKVTFAEAPFDSLIPGLQADRYDAAIGQFGVTGEREKVVDFVSTLSSNELFAARSGAGVKVNGLADLCGRKVSTTRGSREVEFAQTQNPKCAAAGRKPIDIKVFDDSSKASLALMSGRVDVFWLGSTAVQYFVKTTGGQAKVVGQYLDKNPLGTALQKDSAMSKPLRAGVQRTIESGTYAKILKKWGLDGGAITTSDVNPKVSAN